MNDPFIFRIAFLILLVGMLIMRGYFMVKVRRAGERLMPDRQAVEREGGRGLFIARVVVFLFLVAFLVMYLVGMDWIDAFSFTLPAWLRWTGFAVGVVSLIFWIWTQTVLDIQWSAQLQLRGEHRLVTTGPYARIRHPLYTAMFGWGVSLALLTANWIFTLLAVLSIAGVVYRAPREEKMMIEAFGEQYKAYMQHTGRFFPKL